MAMMRCIMSDHCPRIRINNLSKWVNKSLFDQHRHWQEITLSDLLCYIQCVKFSMVSIIWSILTHWIIFLINSAFLFVGFRGTLIEHILWIRVLFWALRGFSLFHSFLEEGWNTFCGLIQILSFLIVHWFSNYNSNILM